MVSETFSSRESGGHQPDSPAPTISSMSSGSLPHPRAHPLRPGSLKEGVTRRFVEGRLLHVSRRYAKKFQPLQPDSDVQGYQSMGEVCRDLSETINVLWLSGTPSLQIPYLLNIALAVTTYLSAFPPEPTPTFALLGKLDYAFASLLQGADFESGETLSGFETGKRTGLSRTDMVRCKSLVETTRVQIVDFMNRQRQAHDQSQPDSGDEYEMDTDMDRPSRERGSNWDDGGDDDDDDNEAYNMDIARVYEKTIVQLGIALETSAI